MLLSLRQEYALLTPANTKPHCTFSRLCSPVLLGETPVFCTTCSLLNQMM